MEEITSSSRLRIWSSDMGRFPQAMRTPFSSLRRSNGWRRPSRLTTLTSSRSISSCVVKRHPQVVHSRRRRIAAPSRTLRESSTLSSSLPHLGHFIASAPYLPLGHIVQWRQSRFTGMGGRSPLRRAFHSSYLLNAARMRPNTIKPPAGRMATVMNSPAN